MKLKKSFKSAILALTLVLAMSACGSEEQGVVQPENETSPSPSAAVEAEKEDETEKTEEAETPVEVGDVDYKEMSQAELMALYPEASPKGTVTVGSSTQMNADLFYGWTNITPNARIKYLLFNDYSLVVTDEVEEFFINNVVVENWDSVDNSDGTKTFTFKIHENLTYNDGSAIDAKDFVFTQLLMSSPEFTAVDGSATYGINFEGYDSFSKGYLVNEDGLAVDADGNVIETVTTDAEGKKTSEFSADKVECKTFSGIKLLGDYEFSITIKAEELPYFYDKAFFYSTYPVPMSVIAPGVELTDDGNGATLSAEFTADLLRETLTDPQKGYRYKPTVTPGAYQFESYDDTTFTAVVTANPNFLCLADGKKPSVEKIVMKLTTQSTQMNELEIGQVDLIEGITTGTQIDAGLEMVDNGILQYDSYPRHGYGKISIHCDFGPTQFESVRQALCYLLDRDEFGRQYSGGYAIVVDSRYSESQWMYQDRKDDLEGKLIEYTLNTDKANEILDEDGWTLDANGGEYVAGAGNIRHKMVDGELMPLVIEWCSSKDNAVSDLLAVMLPPAAEQVGMKINQAIQDSVLDTFYRVNVDEPFFHIFNMGTGFGTPDAPWTAYSSKPEYWGAPYNQNFILNPVLEETTEAMKRTDPEDREAFLDLWEEYIIEWNRTLPDIPLYANIYHDFYSNKIEGYSSTPTWNWARNIPRCTVSE